ncbi:MAG: hypothetical protein ACOCX8_01295, partial [Bacteroidota bacterium]
KCNVMKKTLLIPIITVLSLSAIIIINSCSKSESNSKLSTVEQEYKEAPGGSVYQWTCTGNCTNGQECGMHLNIKENYYECTCEGCVMTITIRDGDAVSQQELITSLRKKDLFLKELEAFVFNKHGIKNVVLKSVEFAKHDSGYFILYEYFTLDGNTETVTYSYVEGNQDENPKI